MCASQKLPHIRRLGVAVLSAALILPFVIHAERARAQELPSWAEEAYEALNQDLSRILQDQRDYFAVYDKYATDFKSVGCHSSPGVTVAITASEWGISAVATHEHLGTEFGCSAYLGHMDPPDSPVSPDAPGVIACTSGSPSTPQSDGNPWPELADGPTFSVHDVAPTMKDARHVARRMEKEYPRSLLAHQIGGTALVSAFVCQGGHVRAVVVARSSGYEQLDQAALRVAHEIEFTPAIREGNPVGVWVTFPVTFTPGQSGTG